MSKNVHKLLPYATIEAAANGESGAMLAVLAHYQNYIAQLSKRPYYDKYGICHIRTDEGIREQLEEKLLMGMLSFDMERF